MSKETYRLKAPGSNDDLLAISIEEGHGLEPAHLFGAGAIRMQHEIANGNVAVNDRVWPCLWCDGKKFPGQLELIRHLRTHKEEEDRIMLKIREKLTVEPKAAAPERRRRPSFWEGLDDEQRREHVRKMQAGRKKKPSQTV